MKLQNLDKTRFRWFGIQELKNKEEVKEHEKFIRSFTFGPFVPFYIYQFSRKVFDFQAINFAIFYFFRFTLQIIGKFLPPSKIKIPSADISETLKVLKLPETITPQILVISMIIGAVVYVLIKLSECLFSRRLSWNRNEWIDIQIFKKSEKLWNKVGIVFFLLDLLFLFIFILVVIAIL